MIVCHDPKFIYLDPPRTGTNTVIQKLIDLYGDKLQYLERHFCTAKALRINCGEYFTFISIRNPFPRAVSWWQHLGQHVNPKPKPGTVKARARERRAVSQMTFRQWCRSRQYAGVLRARKWSLAHYLSCAFRIDAVLRQEHLEEDFNKLPFLPGPQQLPQKMVSQYAADWWHHYNPPTERLIRDLLQDDFLLLRTHYSLRLIDAIPLEDREDYAKQTYFPPEKR